MCVLLVLALALFSMARVAGVHPALEKLYIPDADGQFSCLDGSGTIPFAHVNRGVCDCADCSDEPGTEVSPRWPFYCGEEISYTPLPHGSVNNGICECCDCEDEPQVEPPANASVICGQARVKTMKGLSNALQIRRNATTALYRELLGREPSVADIPAAVAMSDDLANTPLGAAVAEFEFAGTPYRIGVACGLEAAGERVAAFAAHDMYKPGAAGDPANALSLGAKANLKPKFREFADGLPVVTALAFEGAQPARVELNCGDALLEVAGALLVGGELRVDAFSYMACEQRKMGLMFLVEASRQGKTFSKEEPAPPRDAHEDL
eukprot:gnl/Chilomastix_cuspidata/1879.p1 GENE.gnl/Chilomastix_cuspidata/1879~~gnl/Chilomastix_cuspidata/1879.p1  ORF type:complete len:322 (+),score=125.12 gnl/Chilomastix_cuspidata/1879:22-987(+)